MSLRTLDEMADALLEAFPDTPLGNYITQFQKELAAEKAARQNTERQLNEALVRVGEAEEAVRALSAGDREAVEYQYRERFGKALRELVEIVGCYMEESDYRW
jgi:hypothetical protein